MPNYTALIITARAPKRGEHDFEAVARTDVGGDYPDEETARREFSIRADAEQRARRAQTGEKVVCCYLLIPAPETKE